MRRDLKIFFNGKIVPESDARVSVFDHGLLYGDGIFEGLRSYNGAIFKLTEHTDRLFASAKHLMINIGMTREEINNATLETLVANDLYANAYIRTVVTRGTGDLGINPNKCHGTSTVFIVADEIELYPQFYYEQGLRVVTLGVSQKPVSGLSPMVKSLNYLNNILGTIQVNNYNAWVRGRKFDKLSSHEKSMVVSEGIMLSADGHVTEATADNVFIVKDRVLHTPSVAEGLLAGITRSSIIEIASELGIRTIEDRMTVYDLYTADECFLSGSAAELVPVREIDGRTIGAGVESFSIYSQIRREFPEYVAQNSTTIPR
jgi:branched-chain amino acid aminotransferase